MPASGHVHCQYSGRVGEVETNISIFLGTFLKGRVYQNEVQLSLTQKTHTVYLVLFLLCFDYTLRLYYTACLLSRRNIPTVLGCCDAMPGPSFSPRCVWVTPSTILPRFARASHGGSSTYRAFANRHWSSWSGSWQSQRDSS